MIHHAGRIVLGEEQVLDWLGYPGGRLHFFGRSEDYLGTVAVIEHPSLPEVHEGAMLEIVYPKVVYWSAKDNCLIRFYPHKGLWKRIIDCVKVLLYYWQLSRVMSRVVK